MTTEQASPLSENCLKAQVLAASAQEAARLRDYKVAVEEIESALSLLGDEKKDAIQKLRASLFCQLGRVRIEEGEWQAAHTALSTCLQLTDGLAENNKLRAVALTDLGQTAFKQGQLDAAKTYLDKAIPAATKSNDLATLAFARLWLGAIAALSGNAGLADTELLEAVKIAKRAGEAATEARARNILGENARLHDRFEDAIAHYQEALTIYQSINKPFGMTMVIHNLGHVRTMMGDTETALQHYDASLRMAIDINAIPAALEIIAALAGIAFEKKDFQRSLTLLSIVLAHPAVPGEALHMFAEPVLLRLQSKLPADVVEAGLARGRSLQFETVVEALLANQEIID